MKRARTLKGAIKKINYIIEIIINWNKSVQCHVQEN